MFDYVHSGNSPDLNPQEDVWSYTKHIVYENGGFRSFRALKRKVEKVWSEIPTSVLRNCAHSMVGRCRRLREHPERRLT